MIGNDQDIDALGYFKSGTNAPKLTHIYNRIGSTLEFGVLSQAIMDLEITSNCWICEGWT
jgi:hypothetical protein